MINEPNFLYIGSAKSASSWIWRLLEEHPEAFVSPAKEIHFFDRYYDKGWDWYRSRFTPENGHIAVGEICHDYFLSPEYARRIHKHLPDIRLVCCFREPLSLLQSLYRYDQRVFRLFSSHDYDSGLTFREFVQDERVLAYVSYARNLRPFYELFPAENINVLFFEDLKDSAPRFAEELFSFLGISPIMDLPVMNTVVNPTLKARSRFMAEAAQKIVQFLRDSGYTELVGRLANNPLLERLFFQKPHDGTDDAAHDEVFEQELAQRLHEDDAMLEEMIGRPVPEAWQKHWKRTRDMQT